MSHNRGVPARVTSQSPSHRVLDLLRLAAGYLAERGSPSARLDAEVLLAHVLGMERVQLYVNFDRPVDSQEVSAYRELTRRRARGEPVAYLVGEKEFRSRPFFVTPAVLIPRPETELLVAEVLAALSDSQREDSAAGWVIDVGTGSGIISISLALEQPGDYRISAVDRSPEALAVARKNARRHGVDETIRWLEGDLLAPVWEEGLEPLLAVVSNPPYVATSQWQHLAPTVRDYEPRLALDGGDDGLEIMRRLVAESAQLLAPAGIIALEVGAGQRQAVDDLLAQAGFTGRRWVDDYAGHPRIVIGRR